VRGLKLANHFTRERARKAAVTRVEAKTKCRLKTDGAARVSARINTISVNSFQ